MTLNTYLSSPGDATALARILAVTAVQVSHWRNLQRPVPEGRCPTIEQATDGQVTCEELRHDLHWVRIPDKNWPHPKGRPLVDHFAKGA